MSEPVVIPPMVVNVDEVPEPLQAKLVAWSDRASLSAPVLLNASIRM